MAQELSPREAIVLDRRCAHNVREIVNQRGLRVLARARNAQEFGSRTVNTHTLSLINRCRTPLHDLEVVRPRIPPGASFSRIRLGILKVLNPDGFVNLFRRL